MSLLEQAQAAWRRGAYDEALEVFRAAHRSAPAVLNPRIALAQALVSTGAVEPALALLSAVAGRAPPGEPDLAGFLAAVWSLDEVAPVAVRDPLRAVARHLPFGEAVAAEALLDAWLADAPPPPMTWHSAMAQSRWDSLRQRAASPRPRLFGTAAGVRRAAEAAARVPGLVCEFGVYFGLSLRQWSPGSDGRVHGFDSFEGLPEAWSAHEGAGAYSTGGVRPSLPEHVRLWPGWFKDSLWRFRAEVEGPIRLLHIDCDVYTSTVDVLDGLADRLVSGSVVVFDDFDGYPGFEAHECRAWREFLARHGRSADTLGHAFFGREAAFRLS